MILSLGLVEASKLERLDGDRAADVPGVLKKAPGHLWGLIRSCCVALSSG